MTRVVRFHRTGGPEVMQFDDLPVGDPGRAELRVRIEAIGLNRAEAMFRSGAYLETPRLPARLGYEASATVESVGDEVDGFAPGDPVSVIPAFSMNDYGVYADTAIVPAYSVLRRPTGASPIESAAIWMAYLTAWGALIDIGRLGEGDAVVIPAASSSVGLAAIQVANSVGAISIATTRTRDKAAALEGAGAAHVIVTSEQDLVAAVNRATGGKGARLVFDPVGGPQVETLAEAMSHHGVLVVYGALAAAPTPFPVIAALQKALTMRGYTLFEFVRDEERMARASAFIQNGLAHGRLKPIIAKTFPLDEIVEAHRYMESNQQFGKIVVTVPH
ncbi:zinc-dependent alcohol dehydrogenase family protein [Methylopila sp. Yamaguchi]|uniref:zinc-dependent alcohol dehydrogenase family protein n=1 Tax=Methylopila sp. Yamaguchi TaxID=1437817 RepID=UPI000CBBCA81|nr:zinc-dependent alcohol dehydrogenase family protein [Methylopila sp. Yamaguchi]GBD49561.1 alcohol dehydrogenase zinc-binding domain protein [Methylopila sp. Yamaguchi]